MFKVGDKVKWTSQSQGFTKTKHGEIFGVLEAGEDCFVKYRIPGCGDARNHKSYVVKVNSKLYWPKVKYLVKD